MATPRTTIDALPEQSTPEDTNFLIIQDDGVTKKMSVATLKTIETTQLAEHLADGADAHDATAISTTPSGVGVDSPNVQGQLSQLATLVDAATTVADNDARYINSSGDTMTGTLSLMISPLLPDNAATKGYVDGEIATAVADMLTETDAHELFVDIAGDTLTGPLVLAADPAFAMEAATKQYVDNAPSGITEAEADARYVNLAGDSMSGPLTALELNAPTINADIVNIAAAPVGFNDGTNKEYVDAQVATRLTQAAADARYVNTSGGDTMSGTLQADSLTAAGTVSGAIVTASVIGSFPQVSISALAPAGPDQATRKDYVDGLVPRRGTGFPEGVVTAPVGTEYIDTAATSGAVKWIKATGTGNTGWRVAYGDTGWRGILEWNTAGSFTTGSGFTSLAIAPRTGSAGYVRIRRVGPLIYCSVVNAQAASALTLGTAYTLLTLPVGFYTAGTTNSTYIPTGTIGQATSVLAPMFNGALNFIPGYAIASGAVFADAGRLGFMSWPVGENAAWPATLPGIAAT